MMYKGNFVNVKQSGAGVRDIKSKPASNSNRVLIFIPKPTHTRLKISQTFPIRGEIGQVPRIPRIIAIPK